MDNTEVIIYAALIGAGSALAANLLTSLINLVRERWANQLAIRRDVYIPASKAISQLQVSFQQMATSDPRNPEYTATILRATQDLAPVYLVASTNTVNALSKFSERLQSAFMQHTEMRLELGWLERQETQLRE